MLYLIVAASLIYVSNAQEVVCTGTGVTSGTDCGTEKGIADDACTQSFGTACYTVACDETVDNGFCTIECSSNTDCNNAKQALSLAGTFECDDTTDPKLCKATTQTPVTSSGTTDPCAQISYACTMDTDCEAFGDCMSDGAKVVLTTGNERLICVSNMCTVTCNSADIICDTAESELYARGLTMKLTCNPATSTNGDKTCGLPPNTTPPDGTGTLPPLDITCTTATDCATNLNAFIKEKTGFTPAQLNLEYLCLNDQCTVTCSDTLDICPQVQDAINGELGPNEQITLECAKAEGTGDKKGCVTAGTGYPDTTTATATNRPDTTILDCNDDPCDDGERPECVIPESVDGMCSVRVEFDLDVCILHQGMKRKMINTGLVDACIQFTGPADAVCDGGFWGIESYGCYKLAEPTFDFYVDPTGENECPDNVQEECKKQNNAAHIVGATGLACPCGADADQELIAIRDKILSNAERSLDFAEKLKKVSVTDDEICHEGFGAVEVNKLTVTFRNADGDVVGDIIDITGGVGRMYYYIATVVVLVVVTFL